MSLLAERSQRGVTLFSDFYGIFPLGGFPQAPKEVGFEVGREANSLSSANAFFGSFDD